MHGCVCICVCICVCVCVCGCPVLTAVHVHTHLLVAGCVYVCPCAYLAVSMAVRVCVIHVYILAASQSALRTVEYGAESLGPVWLQVGAGGPTPEHTELTTPVTVLPCLLGADNVSRGHHWHQQRVGVAVYVAEPVEARQGQAVAGAGTPQHRDPQTYASSAAWSHATGSKRRSHRVTSTREAAASARGSGARDAIACCPVNYDVLPSNRVMIR